MPLFGDPWLEINFILFYAQDYNYVPGFSLLDEFRYFVESHGIYANSNKNGLEKKKNFTIYFLLNEDR